MEPIKKHKQKYIQNMYGFSCPILESMENAPTIRQLHILREIIKYSNLDRMEDFTTRGKRYVWINYKLLFTTLKWAKLSRQILSRDIRILVDSDFIHLYNENKKGISRIFFHITDKTRALFLGKIQ